MILTPQQEDELNALMAQGREEEAGKLLKRYFRVNKKRALSGQDWNSTIKDKNGNEVKVIL